MKKLKIFICLFVAFVMVASFLILPVSAKDVCYYYTYTDDILPGFIVEYTGSLEDFGLVPFSFSSCSSFDDDSSSYYGNISFSSLESDYILESGKIYLLSYSIPYHDDCSIGYFSFPKSLRFEVLPDISSLFTVNENVISFDLDFYSNLDSIYLILYPSSNYTTFSFTTTCDSIPLTPPDTSMPPFKVVLSSLSEYVTSNFSWGSEVFDVVSSSPGLLILFLAFPIIGFLLGCMRRLIKDN